MQTFLISPDFMETARCLDRQRLGKQRVEVLQLLKAISGETKGWRNHPCTNMWRNHSNALVLYGQVICNEWIGRGYKDTCYGKISAYFNPIESFSLPGWITDEKLLSSHRSNLLRKAPEYYSQFGWTESDDLEYVWPESDIV